MKVDSDSHFDHGSCDFNPAHRENNRRVVGRCGVWPWFVYAFCCGLHRLVEPLEISTLDVIWCCRVMWLWYQLSADAGSALANLRSVKLYALLSGGVAFFMVLFGRLGVGRCNTGFADVSRDPAAVSVDFPVDRGSSIDLLTDGHLVYSAVRLPGVSGRQLD